MTRAWLYGRRSNDEDVKLESIANQLEIAREYSITHGFTVVGESFDNHVSGMHFNRDGINELIAAVELAKVDVVKDLSRLGRHRTQTDLFIEFLREYNVAVMSATEGLNTLNEEDDLLVGIRGLMNDYYAKDFGNKIRTGYRKKQKDGLVIKAPFGYWKDKNTQSILVHEEAVATVRLIYNWYGDGVGLNEIARRLNQMERKTPGQIQGERCGKNVDRCYWTNTTVKKVLQNECYTGVLINHSFEIRNGKKIPVTEENKIRHEGYLPVIIEKEEWETIQHMLNRSVKTMYGNRVAHRYARFLNCGECGNKFISVNRHTREGTRVEYICKSYQSYGKENRQHIHVAYHQLKIKQEETMAVKRLWELNRRAIDSQIKRLQKEVQILESEVDALLMEKISWQKNSQENCMTEAKPPVENIPTAFRTGDRTRTCRDTSSRT